MKPRRVKKLDPSASLRFVKLRLYLVLGVGTRWLRWGQGNPQVGALAVLATAGRR